MYTTIRFVNILAFDIYITPSVGVTGLHSNSPYLNCLHHTPPPDTFTSQVELAPRPVPHTLGGRVDTNLSVVKDKFTLNMEMCILPSINQ